MTGQAWLYAVFAYLLGSLPSAYIVGRMVGRVDIRCIGDGNIGARNTFFQVGRWAGITVGAIDIAKGSVAVLVAQRAGLDDLWVLIVGGAVVLGHDFMLFLGFQGGQGMATTIGVLLVILPLQTCMGLCIAALVWLLSKRRFNLSMAIGLGAIPMLAWITDEPSERALYPVAVLPIIGMRKLMQMRAAQRLSALQDNGFTD